MDTQNHIQREIPASLDPKTVRYRIFTEEALKYSVEYPDIYSAENHVSQTVSFRDNGNPAFRAIFTDEESGRNRLLWVGQTPAGTGYMGGRTATVYRYRHYQKNSSPPDYVPTITYVAPHMDKFLALEFRSLSHVLDPVQQHVLESFKFLT